MKYLKLLISFAILTYIFIEFNVDIKKFSTISFSNLIILIAIGVCCILLNALRIFYIFKNQNFEIKYLNCLKINMIGSLFDSTLPTSNGGDIVRISYYINFFKTNKTKIASISFIDRLFGFFTFFILIIFSGIYLNFNNPTIDLIFRIVSFLTAFFLLFFLFVGSKRISNYLSKFNWIHKLRIIPIMQVINNIRNSPKNLLILFLITLLNHLLIFYSLFIIIKIFNDIMNVDYYSLILSTSIGMISSVLGVAGGFGIGTLSFIEMYNLLLKIDHIPEIVIFFQIYQLFIKLFGLPVFLYSKN